MTKRAAKPSSFTDSTEPLVRSSERPAPIGAMLRVEGAEAQPERLKLGLGNYVVGSAPGCDVVIADRAVSRQHLELGLVPEGVSVRDLGGGNGTFIDGQRVEKVVLGLGAKLEIGQVTLHLEADAAELEQAPASRSPRCSWRVSRAWARSAWRRRCIMARRSVVARWLL
jgi:hypothetical protein